MEIEKKHNVHNGRGSYDRYNCLSTAQKLEKAGLKTVEVKQHSSVLHPATKLLREKILNKEFFYTPNDSSRNQFSKCKSSRKPTTETFTFTKRKVYRQSRHVASLINAVYLLQFDVIFNPDSDWAIQVF